MNNKSPYRLKEKGFRFVILCHGRPFISTDNRSTAERSLDRLNQSWEEAQKRGILPKGMQEVRP